ncbi:MAG: hypothetical protein WCD24_02120, partial [Serratia inhibens]|uniref:hypothetical protein n=1 Tax=Serratia inhibens TaxID=2338073 RepID=UPI003C7E7109
QRVRGDAAPEIVREPVHIMTTVCVTGRLTQDVNLGDKRGHSPAQNGASDRVAFSVLARVLAT